MEPRTNTSKSALLLVVTATTFMGPFMVSGVNIILPASDFL